ncbi:uncharacterized protein PHACADRAFT_257264 [Phanerochaete carnosa HHB-10118-sp]|uniref:F-box domain-containing protein n=1 Tax=Phanerochaete carnosa (strain HHB-10118-sp) TaxID=650164 RepID=K5V118_PHACS|nr:uncharacterized protein PHACADRAFT_257264 [Phanerochaete carnosa HHB-10118-sp]EKM56181.1 hypothetical protein PHACADRAFT_257264 [Phanerochaete carnosa HHB-10118-sp]
MAGLVDLPIELHLVVLSFLPLPALLAARNTCQHWRHLVPLAPLPHTRRKLLCLFDTLCTIPSFEVSRRTAKGHLQSDFGDAARRSYVASLPKDTGDEFKTWILEWPDDAVVAALWPALDKSYNMSNTTFPHRLDICNRMPTPSYAPQTHTLSLSLYAERGCGPANVVALPLFDEGNGWTHWVVLSGEQEMLDARGKNTRIDLRGAVFSKIRSAEADERYAGFLESPSPSDCPSSVITSPRPDSGSHCRCPEESLLSPAGPETWGPWYRYLEQETRKLQTSMEEYGAWCGCLSCRTS